MPIRLRIVLATAGIMILSLVILGSGIYLSTSRDLHRNLDARLASVYENYQRNPGEWLGPGGRLGLLTNPNPFASSGVFVQIRDRSGDVAARSENLGRRSLPVTTDVLTQNIQLNPAYYTADTTAHDIRILSGPLLGPDGLAAFVQIGESLGPLESTLADLRRNLIAGSLLATAAVAAAAWIAGDAIMRPLSRMSTTARGIGHTSDLSRRLDPPQTHDEVQDLALTFNEMFARLEESVTAQRRFVADASHELRTPLTALRANSEIMLRQLKGGLTDHGDLVEGLTDIHDEVERMSRLVQSLLTLARADVGWRPEMEAIDLSEIARDASRKAAALLKGQQFELDVPQGSDGPGAVPVYGNADQMTQLVLILLDNAFTYAPTGTTVRLAMEREQEHVVLAISDNGPGIEQEHLSRIFERFYRTDGARTRSTAGAGLGLAIADWIVSVHNGTIDVTSEPGHGATFSVRLPLLANADASNEPHRNGR